MYPVYKFLWMTIHWYDVLVLAAFLYCCAVVASVKKYNKRSFIDNLNAAIEDELRW